MRKTILVPEIFTGDMVVVNQLFTFLVLLKSDSVFLVELFQIQCVKKVHNSN